MNNNFDKFVKNVDISSSTLKDLNTHIFTEQHQSFIQELGKYDLDPKLSNKIFKIMTGE